MGCLPNKNKNKEEDEKKIVKKSVENNEDFAEFDLIFYKKNEEDFVSVKVELFFSCKDLLKLYRSQKGNFMIVFCSFFDEHNLMEEGRTEVSRDNFNPVFIKTFVVNYRFQSQVKQKFLCQVYYVEEIHNSDDLNSLKLLGEAEFILANLVSFANQEIVLDLSNKEFNKKDKLGKIHIKAIEKEENPEFVSFNVGVKGRLTKNPIACKILGKRSYQEYIPIYMTKEVVQTSYIFYWDTIEIPINYIIKGHEKGENKIQFLIYEVLKSGKIKVISQIDILTVEFFKYQNKTEINLFSAKTNKKKMLLLNDIKRIYKFKLFNFLVSKLDIKTFFFLDMTNSKINQDCAKKVKEEIEGLKNEAIIQLSNLNLYHLHGKKVEGDANRRSIHSIEKFKSKISTLKKDTEHLNDAEIDVKILKSHQSPKNIISQNQTEKILKKEIESWEEMYLLNESIVKRFLTFFDTDNRYPVMGFGCIFPSSSVSLMNSFAFTKDIMKPELSGSQNIFNSYKNILKEVTLYGPAILCENMNLYLKFLKSHNYTDS